MRKHLFAALLMSAACGSKSPPPSTTPAPAPTTASSETPEQATGAQPAVAISPTSAKATYGKWGFDTDGMDKKVSAGSSFYNYANGTWVKNTPIPEDKSNYGMFSVLSDQSDERTKDIILNAKGASGTEAQKIAD